MSWLSWAVLGLVAGALAKGVTGQHGAGCLGTIAIGIVGALVGGALFKAAGDEGINDFSVRSLLVAFVGATVLLFLYRVASGAPRRR